MGKGGVAADKDQANSRPSRKLWLALTALLGLFVFATIYEQWNPAVDTQVVTRANGERIDEYRALGLCRSAISRQRGTTQGRYRKSTAILGENSWALTVAVSPRLTAPPDVSEIWSCRVHGDTSEIRVRQVF